MNNSTMDNKWSVDEETVNRDLNRYSVYADFCAFFTAQEEEIGKIEAILKQQKHIKHIRIYTETESEILMHCIVTIDGIDIKREYLHTTVCNAIEYIKDKKYVIMDRESSQFYSNNELIGDFKFNGIKAFKHFLDTEEEVKYYVLFPPLFSNSNRYTIDESTVDMTFKSFSTSDTTLCFFNAKNECLEEIEQVIKRNEPTRYMRLYIEAANAIKVGYLIANDQPDTQDIVLEMAKRLAPYMEGERYILSDNLQTILYAGNSGVEIEKSAERGTESLQKYFPAEWTNFHVNRAPGWIGRMGNPYYIYVRYIEGYGITPVTVPSDSFNMSRKKNPKS